MRTLTKAFALTLCLVVIGSVYTHAKEKDKNEIIIVSTLSVAPPGYEIERVIGSTGSYDAKSYETGFFLKSNTLKLIGRVERDLLEIVKKQGGNAILNEHVDVRPTLTPNQLYIHVLIQGDIVILRPIEEKAESN